MPEKTVQRVRLWLEGNGDLLWLIRTQTATRPTVISSTIVVDGMTPEAIAIGKTNIPGLNVSPAGPIVRSEVDCVERPTVRRAVGTARDFGEWLNPKAEVCDEHNRFGLSWLT